MTAPLRRAVAVVAVAVWLAACTGGGTGAGGTPGPLTGVCPDPVVIQTDWNPEAEYGAVYALLGADATVDESRKRVRGPLLDGNTPAGVDVEIRSGGPAIGFQTVSAQLHQDPGITIGLVNTDEAVRFAEELPTVAVLALFERSPLMVMWDPATHPDVQGIADLGRRSVPILYYGPDTYMTWLLAEGTVTRGQLDGGYDGSPARFVAADGEIAQQGFATAEPYIYAEEIAEWGRPVAFELLDDLGYDPYPFALSVRADRLDELAPCLAALVPVVQRAGVRFLADPDPTLQRIVDLVERYDTGWVYSAGVAGFSVRQQRDLDLVAGPGDRYGELDLDRLDAFLAELVPALQADGVAVPDGLTAGDLATNRFQDPTVRVPGDPGG